MKEKKLQNLISNNISIQKSICAALDLNEENVSFSSEFRLENGMIADFLLHKSNKIFSIIETI